jgi:peptide/nickel transport system substrate-binding protein
MIQGAGPWGTGPYQLVEGFSLPGKRSDRVFLEANPNYWDRTRMPRVKRIVFDNTLSQQEAVELVKTAEGRVDLVSELRPLDTLRVAQSPLAKVVKNRGSLITVYGLFNVRKAESPWRDVRLRQAANVAIHREDLIRYATRGNGAITPALLPVASFGYDPDLVPYAFDPGKARHLLREAGYSDGLALSLIAPEDLEVQATVVSKMLEQAGFRVTLQMLDPDTFNRQTRFAALDQPPEQQPWDIALWAGFDLFNFPALDLYGTLVRGFYGIWVIVEPELRQLYEQVLGTVDRERQHGLFRQMERHTRDQASFLFLYNPIGLYAVNKAVEFVPHVNGMLNLVQLSVADEHWSVRGDRKGP